METKVRARDRNPTGDDGDGHDDGYRHLLRLQVAGGRADPNPNKLVLDRLATVLALKAQAIALRARLERQLQTCGAKTRTGTPCRCKYLLNGGRCKFHGGMSTGPKTKNGKSRSLAAAWAGWLRWRAARTMTLPGGNANSAINTRSHARARHGVGSTTAQSRSVNQSRAMMPATTPTATVRDANNGVAPRSCGNS